MEITKGRAVIQIARPMGNDPGAVECSDWQLRDGLLTLVDSQGKAWPRGKGQRWERSVRAGEDPDRVARELLWARYRAGKSGKDFNRRIRYPTIGIV